MNPYVLPFTMPDGSVRRPIVERVPELNRLDPDDGPYSREAELALCQRAVQDWIVSTNAVLHLRIYPDSVSVRWISEDKPKYERSEAEIALPDGQRFWHTCFDDLPTAAHAVADALGVPA